MQGRQEAVASSQAAIEQVLSSAFFTENPSIVAATPIGVDINGDGNDDYDVTMALPRCLRTAPVVMRNPPTKLRARLRRQQPLSGRHDPHLVQQHHLGGRRHHHRSRHRRRDDGPPGRRDDRRDHQRQVRLQVGQGVTHDTALPAPQTTLRDFCRRRLGAGGCSSPPPPRTSTSSPAARAAAPPSPTCSIILDNSSNWSSTLSAELLQHRQHGGQHQVRGRGVRAAHGGRRDAPTNVRLGLMMFAETGDNGAYVRFGDPRHAPTQNKTAFSNMLGNFVAERRAAPTTRGRTSPTAR